MKLTTIPAPNGHGRGGGAQVLGRDRGDEPALRQGGPDLQDYNDVMAKAGPPYRYT